MLIVIPKFVINGEMSLIYLSIGRRMTFVNDDMVNELGILQQNTEQTIIKTG